jgi:hypothetical protein
MDQGPQTPQAMSRTASSTLPAMTQPTTSIRAMEKRVKPAVSIRRLT